MRNEGAGIGNAAKTFTQTAFNRVIMSVKCTFITQSDNCPVTNAFAGITQYYTLLYACMIFAT